MAGSFRLGRIAGIEIDIHWSWLLALVFFTASLAISWLPAAVPGQSVATYWIAGLIVSVLFFVAVLLHELGHSLLARSRGLPVRRIVLHVFGGVSDLTQEPRTPGDEIIISGIGPLVSLVLGGIFWVIAGAFGPAHPLLRAATSWLALVNVLLGIFNLLPAFPLDGGRVLRGVLWAVTGSMRRATRWSALVGQVLAYLLIFWGVWLFFVGATLSGIWTVFIGLFLLDGARTASRQLVTESLFRGTRVADVMQPSPPSIPADLSLQDLMERPTLPNGWRAFPVEQMGELVGLMTLADARAYPREEWSRTPVSQAMIPIGKVQTARPDEPLYDVTQRMAEANVNQVLVVDHGQPVGMLTRESILQFLRHTQESRAPQSRPPVPYQLPRAG